LTAPPEPAAATGPPDGASSGAPRVWILESTGAGANRQLRHLAAALGWPYAFKPGLDSVPRVLAERLYPRGWRRVPARKRVALHPPWPDLVLFSGGRSVVDALRIRAESGGRARLVCIGRPWAPLQWFDRTIVTPQYRLPKHPRVLHITLPLSGADPGADHAAARRWQATWTHLPRPWIGVLLGGSSGSCRFTKTAARRLGRLIDERARALGGAALITSSARTPPAALGALLGELRAPHYCYRWHDGDGDNPIAAILALADCFVVTADSASMPSEACATGRPVASFTPPLRWRARLLSRLRLPDSPGMLRALRQWLVLRGLWIPARDMSRVHRELEQRGLIGPIETLKPGAAGSATPVDDTPAALASVRELLPAGNGRARP